MASEKRLNSVCHSLAHHATSGLSFIHPHAVAACRQHNAELINADLLSAEPCPAPFCASEPLRLSLGALAEKLGSILAAEGFSKENLNTASATFWPDPAFSDGYGTICRAVIVSKSGRRFEHTLDCLGRSRNA
jgi:hypothetical protein